MSLFKNGVGRPSNETKRKRSMFYIVTTVVLIAVMIVSGYLIITKFNGSLNSDNKNAKVPNKPTIGLYNGSIKNTNKYKIGSWTNKNVIVTASSNSSGKKYYEYELTGAKNTKGKGSQVTISNTGISQIRFRTCFYENKKCSAYTQKYSIKIDKTVPTIKYDKKVKYNKGIYDGYVTISCTDEQSLVNSLVVTGPATNGKNNAMVTKKVYGPKKTLSIKLPIHGTNDMAKGITTKCANTTGSLKSGLVYFDKLK